MNESKNVMVKLDLQESLKETKKVFQENCNTNTRFIYCRMGNLKIGSEYINLFKTDIGQTAYNDIMKKIIVTVEDKNIKTYQQKEYFFTDKVYIVKYNPNGNERSCWSIYDVINQDFVNKEKYEYNFDVKLSVIEITEYDSTKFPSLKTYHSVKNIQVTEITLEDGNVVQFKKTEENENFYYSLGIEVNDFDGIYDIISFILGSNALYEGRKVYSHNYEEEISN